MYRVRAEEKAYKRLPKSAKCPFCNLQDPNLNPRKRRIIKQTATMLVLDNSFPYQLWEHHDVIDHLMVIPKRHLASMQDLNDQERKEMMDIFCEYQAKNYDVYARSPKNARRTVTHIHEHLIKIDKKLPRLYLYLKKPYFVFKA